MALIKCKECGKSISDTATICPNCGIELQITNESTINMGIFDYILIGLIILFCVAMLFSPGSMLIKIIPCVAVILLYLQLKLERKYSSHNKVKYFNTKLYKIFNFYIQTSYFTSFYHVFYYIFA